MSSKRVCFGAAVSTLLCLGVFPAGAAISLDFVPVDNSAALTGYTTYDMQVTTDTDWTAGAMLFELSAGSLYQHAQGADRGPANPYFISLFPALEFDTYVVGNTVGGGGDVGGDGYAFNAGELDVSWYNMVPDQVGTTTIARLTLTDDAAGSMAVMFTAAGNETAEFGVAILGGAAPQVTELIEEPKAETVSLYDRSPKEWVLPDGSTFWSINQPVEGAVRKPRQYSYIDQRNQDNLFLTPTFEQRPVSDSRRALYGNFWPYADSAKPIPEDTAADESLPEPGTFALVGVCVGVTLLRRR